MSLLLLYRSRGLRITGSGGGGGWIPREVQQIIDELWNYQDAIPRRRRKPIPEFKRLKVQELEVPDILKGLIVLADEDCEEFLRKRLKALEGLLSLPPSLESPKLPESDSESREKESPIEDVSVLLANFEEGLHRRRLEIEREKERAEQLRKQRLEEEEELIALILAIID